MRGIEKPKKRGCTGFPEGNWHGCCVRHDQRYEQGTSIWDKISADWELMLCVFSKKPLLVALLDVLEIKIWPIGYLIGKPLKGLLALCMFIAVMTLGLHAWYQHRYYQWRANR